MSDQTLLNIKNAVMLQADYANMTFLDLQVSLEKMISNYTDTWSYNNNILQNHIASHALLNAPVNQQSGMVNYGYLDNNMDVSAIVNNCWRCGQKGHVKSECVILLCPMCEGHFYDKNKLITHMQSCTNNTKLISNNNNNQSIISSPNNNYSNKMQRINYGGRSSFSPNRGGGRGSSNYVRDGGGRRRSNNKRP